ncbi:CHAP domain-containing protein [Bailinhaonella thermotolerans]|uniref:CHAP domain-containing protein n=1 Tax=Bailinhaonella thermotolerans TaxID=1070861 RepID=A0A3A4A5N7_9ACTN|nr:CHAP domain-containing protein [Bailinhaonella thermotolerans]
MDPIASRLLKAAQNEVGQKEGGDGRTKYGDWYAAQISKEPAQQAQPWCGSFVAWAADRAGAEKYVGQFAHAPSQAAWFKSYDAWSTKPEPGAVAFLSLKKPGAIDQVGIVEKVENGKIHTIEGDVNGVAVQRMVRDQSQVAGYGLPREVKAATTAKPLLTGTTDATYFWDDGSGINGDTGAPYSGKPMQKGLFASPSWPQGTEGYVYYKGKKAKFFIGDLGPGAPSSDGTMLDMDGMTFADLVGGSWNPGPRIVEPTGTWKIHVKYEITKWGPGMGVRDHPRPYSERAFRVMEEDRQQAPKVKAAKAVTAASKTPATIQTCADSAVLKTRPVSTPAASPVAAREEIPAGWPVNPAGIVAILLCLLLVAASARVRRARLDRRGED